MKVKADQKSIGLDLLGPELLRFLKSPSPEVLCISGRWGVGKTYAWNHFLQQAQRDGNVALDRYAYVSLFGRESLDDVRAAMVENSVDSRVINNKPDLRSLDNVVGHFTAAVTDLKKLAALLPGASSVDASLNRALFLGYSKHIICFDDLERAGKNLDIKSIMGIVSQLKEEKECKVVLLLNKEKMTQDTLSFEQQLEKVADRVLVFEPTAAQSGVVSLDASYEFRQKIQECIEILNLTNIRVIKRIEKMCIRASEILASHDPRVKEEAVALVTLLQFVTSLPDEIPSLPYIKSFNSVSFAINREVEISPEESQSRLLLNEYDFQGLDEFGSVILEGVQRGFFDPVKLIQSADVVQKRILKGDKNKGFEDALEKLYGSFADDEGEVMDALASSILTNAEAITPGNLDSVITLLKEFGRTDDAIRCIKQYVATRSFESKYFWDINKHAIYYSMSDKDVIHAFNEKLASVSFKPELEDILLSLGSEKGWDEEDIGIAASYPVSEYYSVFKSSNGKEHRKIIKGALIFKDVGGRSAAASSMTEKALEALRTIGGESAINHKRVQFLGIAAKKGPDS